MENTNNNNLLEPGKENTHRFKHVLHDVGKDYNNISVKFRLQFNSKKHITYLNNEDSQ